MWEPNRPQGQTPQSDRPTGQTAQPGWAHLPERPDAQSASGNAGSEAERLDLEALMEMPPADAYVGEAEDGEPDADLAEMRLGGAVALDAYAQRAQIRQLIREFLRAVPRNEVDAVLMFARPDGTVRQLTRAQLSTAIDRLRPRQRQIVRLTLEERWPRARVCAYLKNISIKTLERDQVEALDILAQL